MRRLLGVFIALLFVQEVSVAQGFAGKYTASTAPGVTLTLTQNAEGEVAGTLALADASFAAQGVLDDGSVLGTMTGGAGGVYFLAEFVGQELHLTLFEPDANNQPDYQSGQTIVFSREAAVQQNAAKAESPVEQVSREEALKIAFGLPRILALNVTFSRAMVVEAVYAASAAMGQVVYYGTLNMTQMGSQYVPQPTDRLVVHLGQQTHEFVVHQAQGNSQAANASAWLMSPHVLRYTHRLPGQAEALINAQYDGSRFEATAKGWYTQSGKRYNIDLSAVGRTTGVRDYGGQDTRTDYRLTGTVSGSGLSLQVDESHTSTLVAATSVRMLPSQRGSASRINATINNILRFAGSVYRLQDVVVQTDQKTKGGNSQGGMTGLSGQLVRDGKPYGRFVNRGGQAVLETGDGAIALGTR